MYTLISRTFSHLNDSFRIASTYGRFGRSENVGSRSVPTTWSISSRARLNAFGWRTSASNADVSPDTVYNGTNHDKLPAIASSESNEERTVSEPPAYIADATHLARFICSGVPLSRASDMNELTACPVTYVVNYILKRS